MAVWILLADLGWHVAIGLQSAGAYWDYAGDLIAQRFDYQRVQAGVWGYGLDEGYVDWGLYLQGVCMQSGDFRRCTGEWAALQYSRALPLGDQMILMRLLVGWDLDQHPYLERAQMDFARPESLWLDRFGFLRQGAAFVDLGMRWLFPTGGAMRFYAGVDVFMNFPEGAVGRETRMVGFADAAMGAEAGVGIRVSYNVRAGEDLGRWIFEVEGRNDTLQVMMPSSRVMYLIPYFFVRQHGGEFRLWLGLPGRVPYTLEGPGVGGLGGVVRQTWGLAIEGRWSPLWKAFREGRWW